MTDFTALPGFRHADRHAGLHAALFATLGSVLTWPLGFAGLQRGLPPHLFSVTELTAELTLTVHFGLLTAGSCTTPRWADTTAGASV
jgi:hypothetical protein